MTLRRSTTVVVVAGCLIAVVTYGMRASLGLFTQPLSDLRGWDRETFAFAIAIQNLLWGIGQPFAGAIADRFGPGRVLAEAPQQVLDGHREGEGLAVPAAQVRQRLREQAEARARPERDDRDQAARHDDDRPAAPPGRRRCGGLGAGGQARRRHGGEPYHLRITQ